MKKFLFAIVSLAVLSAATSSVYAQDKPISFGFKVGLNTESTSISDYKTDLNLVNIKDQMGFHAGIAVRFKASFFIFQPELMYSQNLMDISQVPIRRAETANNNNFTVKTYNVDMPLLVGVKFGPLRINAGPSLNFYTGEKITVDAVTESVKLKKPAISYVAGIGLDLGRISIDGRYQGQFDKSKVHIGDFPIQTNLTNWQLSLGLWF